MGFSSSYITVQYQFPAIHCWRNCHIDEVDFLQNDHRHIFFVDLVLPVTHDDRDLEFFMVQKDLDIITMNLDQGVSGYNITYLGSKSCEMIAKEIISAFLERHPTLPWIRCTVKEDNENGGGVMWEREDLGMHP